MNEILGYMTESEKDLYLIERAHDITMGRLNFLFESLTTKEKLNMEEAELKVMQESGNYDDLETLYEAAASETSEKKKGIIASIAQAISNFISTLLEKLSGIFGKKKEDEYEKNLKKIPSVKMDENPKSVLARLQKRANAIMNSIKHPDVKTKEDETKTIDKKVATGGLLVSAALIFAAYKGGKALAKNIQAFADQKKADKAAEKAKKNFYDTFNPESGNADETQKKMNALSNVSKEVGGFLKSLVGTMESSLSSVASTAKNGVENVVGSAEKAGKRVINKYTKKAEETLDNIKAEESALDFDSNVDDDLFMESAEYDEDAKEIFDILSEL